MSAYEWNLAVGRFMGVDPLADKYSAWSPYTYTLNNPVLLIDPNGMSADSVKIGYVNIGFWNHTNIIQTNNETGEKTKLVEGQPDNQPAGETMDFIKNGFKFGNLKAEKNDLIPDEKDMENVPIPENMTEEEFVAKIKKNFKSYDNNVTYAMFPNSEEGEGNSNSLVGSVLRASSSDFSPSRNTPGFKVNVLPGNRSSKPKKKRVSIKDLGKLVPWEPKF